VLNALSLRMLLVALVGWLDQFRAKHPEFDATAVTA
jgi:hypothetical protein